MLETKVGKAEWKMCLEMGKELETGECKLWKGKSGGGGGETNYMKSRI